MEIDEENVDILDHVESFLVEEIKNMAENNSNITVGVVLGALLRVTGKLIGMCDNPAGKKEATESAIEYLKGLLDEGN